MAFTIMMIGVLLRLSLLHHAPRLASESVLQYACTNQREVDNGLWNSEDDSTARGAGSANTEEQPFNADSGLPAASGEGGNGTGKGGETQGEV
jgi:hypothetical protein